ncbi:OmpA family protein [Halioxenophilus aromaticivorans]|uniref:OmpA-like domain-containing protein n=1 Tax=Halioxenophilus aromaticivorans TaxID=1306992 RepID=A0AAV3UA23_9ALTE
MKPSSLLCGGWRPFLVVPLVLFFIALFFYWRNIEADVETNALQVLLENGHGWAHANTRNQGRTVVLSGVAPSEQVRDAALALAEDAWGVADVEWQGSVAIEETATASEPANELVIETATTNPATETAALPEKPSEQPAEQSLAKTDAAEEPAPEVSIPENDTATADESMAGTDRAEATEPSSDLTSPTEPQKSTQEPQPAAMADQSSLAQADVDSDPTPTDNSPAPILAEPLPPTSDESFDSQAFATAASVDTSAVKPSAAAVTPSVDTFDQTQEAGTEKAEVAAPAQASETAASTPEAEAKADADAKTETEAVAESETNDSDSKKSDIPKVVADAGTISNEQATEVAETAKPEETAPSTPPLVGIDAENSSEKITANQDEAKKPETTLPATDDRHLKPAEVAIVKSDGLLFISGSTGSHISSEFTELNHDAYQVDATYQRLDLINDLLAAAQELPNRSMISLVEETLVVTGIVDGLGKKKHIGSLLAEIYPGSINNQIRVMLSDIPKEELISPEDCQQQFTDLTSRENIQFETAEAIILPASYALLDALTLLARRCPDAQFSVIGHTDNTGDPAYNKTISQQRAQAVVDHIANSGVDAARFTAQGLGPIQPIANNATPEGRAKNRRVEFKLKTQ